MDLAQVEYHYPDHRGARRITPENLAGLDQEQIESDLREAGGGPNPDGAFDGTILMPRGMSGKFGWRKLQRVRRVRSATSRDSRSNLGETLWRGKVFYRMIVCCAIESRTCHSSRPPVWSRTIQENGLRGPAELAALSRKAVLRSKPARCAARIDNHRLFLTDEIPGYQENPDYWRDDAA